MFRPLKIIFYDHSLTEFTLVQDKEITDKVLLKLRKTSEKSQLYSC